MRKCLYHANCNDGIAAALAVWRRHRGMDPEKDFIPVQYGEQPPWEEIEGRIVYIVDFSYPADVLMKMSQVCAQVVVLDHHISAQRDLEGRDWPPNVTVVFDGKRSGAVLAWEHLHPEDPLPAMFSYVQDRDLWTKRLLGSDHVARWLGAFPKTVRTWDELREIPVFVMIQEGEAIDRWFRRQCTNLVEAWLEDPTFAVIGGHRVPVVNAPGFMASEVAGELADGFPFAAVFFHVSDGVVYSLRRREGNMDVSRVAGIYGGGGHVAAAGFKVSEVLGMDVGESEEREKGLGEE